MLQTQTADARCPFRTDDTTAPIVDHAGGIRGLRRWLLQATGIASLVLGVVGIFVPLLPTTCFLLGAAWCFGRSSPRLSRWMYGNQLFGAHLSRYRDHRAVHPSVKVGSLTVLWSTLAATVVLVAPPVWLTALLALIGAGVTLHVGSLATVRTRP